MTLVKNILYNFSSSLIIRGSTLLVLAVAFSLLESEAYFNFTRLVLLTEVISGFSNVLSKHGIMRRKFLFRDEIVSLIYVQTLLVILVFFIFNAFHVYISSYYELSRDLFLFAAFLAVNTNINYIFESVLRKDNLYKEIARLYLKINCVSLILFFILCFYDTELSPYVFIAVQKIALLISTGYYTFIKGLLSARKPNKKVLASYHGKYSLHTLFEGISVAVYRPGMQLAMAPFISVQQASLLFLALRFLEGVAYQLPLNLAQVFYTNFRASFKHQMQAWNYIFLYQCFLLAFVWIWHYFYPSFLSDDFQLILLGFTILPYMLLLNSQNYLMFNKKVGFNILLSICTRASGVLLLYYGTRYYALNGYILAYTFNIFLSSFVFLYFTQKSIPNILYISLILFLGAVFFV